jgi:hypothetical protein
MSETLMGTLLDQPTTLAPCSNVVVGQVLGG